MILLMLCYAGSEVLEAFLGTAGRQHDGDYLDTFLATMRWSLA
jgi:hypothetical protein